MHFNGFISDYLELVFLLKSFWIFIEKEDVQLFACYRFKIENVVCAFKCTHQLAIEKLYEDYCKGPPQQFDFSGMQAKMIYRPTSFTALRLSYKSGTPENRPNVVHKW